MDERKIKYYRFRALGLGNIISKSGKVTADNMAYLNEIWVSETYGIKNVITSKYFEKGKSVESKSIYLIQKCFHPNDLLPRQKEKVRLYNEFLSGEPDLVFDGFVYEIKNAYDFFTFQKASLTHNYEWQCKAYMWLSGLKKCRFIYFLMNMPEELIAVEEKKLYYSENYTSTENPEYIQRCEELRKSLDFTNLRDYERFKLWDVELSDLDVKTIEEAVETARKQLLSIQMKEDERLISNMEIIKKSHGI